MTDVCKWCGVLPQYGHFEWCKVDRAPTADEIIHAVIGENERSVGYEGPSETLASMCKAYLTSQSARLEMSGGEMIKRYKNRVIGCPECGTPKDDLREHPEGDWVEYEFYAALEARCRELETELEDSAKHCRHWHAKYMALQYPDGPPPFPGGSEKETKAEPKMFTQEHHNLQGEYEYVFHQGCGCHRCWTTYKRIEAEQQSALNRQGKPK